MLTLDKKYNRHHLCSNQWEFHMPDHKTHYLGAGDVAKRRELLAQFVVGDCVIEILDVQVDSVITTQSFRLYLLKLLLQLGLSLGLLLGSADVQLVPVNVLAIQLLDRLHNSILTNSSSDSTVPQMLT